MHRGIKDASATVGAREFHTKTGVAKKQREVEAYFIDNFVDPGTGSVKEWYVRRRPCPLCGENAAETIFTKNGFEHLLCGCGMIYVAMVLKNQYLNMLYADDKYEEETHISFRTEPRKSFIESLYQEGLDFLNSFGKNSGLLCDVGCSSGLFMEYAIRNGAFSVQGIEPSQFAVDLCRKNGLDATCGYFKPGILADNSMDVITLWDVLEHCDEIGEVLEAVYSALKPGGVVFLQVPNAMGLAPRIMRQDCNMFTGFGHINLFGPHTLEAMLEKHKFTDIAMQTVISEISVVNNYINYHDPYHGPSDERERFLEVIDLETIRKNLWGYKLQAVGIKAG